MGNGIKLQSIVISILIITSLFFLNYIVSASPPSLSITTPSEAYVLTPNDHATINVSVTDGTNQVSTFINWNESLVAYWNFENINSTGIFDNSTNSNFGTYGGGLTESDNNTGKFGTAMNFDGVDDFINCGDAGNDDFEELTIEAWIRRDSDSPSGWRTALHRNDNTNVGSSVFFIGLETGTHNIVATIGAGSGAGYMAGDTNVFSTLDTWFHVVCVWDGLTVRTYVNGIERVSYGLSSSVFNNKVGITMLGTSYSASGYNFAGDVDEVRIWSRVLSQEEINASYNSTELNYLNKEFSSLPNDNYSYYAHAINPSGEESTTNTQYINVSVDVTPPVSSVDSIGQYNQTTSPLNLTATATDAHGIKNVSLYYRHSLDNITWAHTISENWWNQEWKFRKLITVDSSQVGANLTNFPVLVSLSSDNNLLTNAQSDGDDILFISYDDNTTQYNHEIELFNGSTGELVCWVNITELSSTSDTMFWMYYGNSTCNNQENIEGTWNSDFEIVHHLQESPTNGVAGHLDSTSNNNDATPNNFGVVSGSTTDGSGKIDGANEFDGTNDYVIISDNFIHSPTSLTISSWIKKESGGSTYECALHKASSTAIGTSDYWLGVCTDDYLTATIGANAGAPSGWAAGKTTTKATYGEWYYLTASWDGSVVRVYINGIYDKQYNLGSYTGLTTATRFGASSNGANYQFKGSIDEVRISNCSRSGDWIGVEYNTTANTDTFISIGIEEGSGWELYTNDTNPDLSSPWSWDFNFPNGTGYYEFYSIACDNNNNTEGAPGIADAICYYTSSSPWDTSEQIVWYIVNLTDTVIFNLSINGNISIVGTLYESSSSPANAAFTMNNVLWLTISGDLHIAGTITSVAIPSWKIENIANEEILKMSSDGNLEIAGSLFENV